MLSLLVWPKVTLSGFYSGCFRIVDDKMFNHVGGTQPSELRAVDVKVWENSQCSSSYGNQAPGVNFINI